MRLALKTALALALFAAAAPAREITVEPFPGPAFRPGYWMVVKVTLDDAAGVTHVRLRNAAGGLAVEVPLAEARSGMPVLFHRMPRKVQVTLLDRERQVEQQDVLIKLTPLSEDDVSLLVITTSPVRAQTIADNGLRERPRQLDVASPQELGALPAITGPYSHIAVDAQDYDDWNDRVRKAVLDRMAIGGVKLHPGNLSLPGWQDHKVRTVGMYMHMGVPQAASRPVGEPNIDMDLMMSFARPRWPKPAKDWTLLGLSFAVAIVLLGAVCQWAFRLRFAMLMAMPFALMVTIPTLVALTSIDPVYRQVLRVLSFRELSGQGRRDTVLAVSTLADAEAVIDAWDWPYLVPLYFSDEHARRDDSVLRLEKGTASYRMRLTPQQIACFYRSQHEWSVPSGTGRPWIEPIAPDTYSVRGKLPSGWLLRGDKVTSVPAGEHYGLFARLTFTGEDNLGDVIDTLLADPAEERRQIGRILRYLRDSRRLIPTATYYAGISWRTSQSYDGNYPVASKTWGGMVYEGGDVLIVRLPE